MSKEWDFAALLLTKSVAKSLWPSSTTGFIQSEYQRLKHLGYWNGIKHPAYFPPKAQEFVINRLLHFERYDSFVRCRTMTLHTLAQKVRCHAVLRYRLLVSAQRKSQCVCFGTFYIWCCHYVLFYLIQMYWSVSGWMEISTTSVAPNKHQHYLIQNMSGIRSTPLSILK
jgi:hypothetical protein